MLRLQPALVSTRAYLKPTVTTCPGSCDRTCRSREPRNTALNRLRNIHFCPSESHAATSARLAGGASEATHIKDLKRLPFPAGPDGRYVVVGGRLWRCTSPDLPDDTTQRLVTELMKARRQKGVALPAKDQAAVLSKMGFDIKENSEAKHVRSCGEVPDGARFAGDFHQT
jgi:hypothetical protein